MSDILSRIQAIQNESPKRPPRAGIRSAHISVRCSPVVKSRLQQRATEAGMSLTDYMVFRALSD